MWNRKEQEAVSPVIAVILMVAITVVLAAVLFVMVQNIGTGTPEIIPMSGIVDENNAGWVVSIKGSPVENTSSVSWYIQNATDGTKVAGVTIAFNDIDADGYIGTGDTFFISDSNHDQKYNKFIVDFGESTLEVPIQ